jgi:hypothetical protein
MNTTLSPVTVQRFSAVQGELIGLVEQDYNGLTPKLEQIIRAFEFTQIELAVYRDRGYGQGRGAGQPEADRCVLGCAFLSKAVLDLKSTRALIDRLKADSKLRRLCGFDLRFGLPSEATFSRAFAKHRHNVLTYQPQATRIKLEVCSTTGAEPPLRRQAVGQSKQRLLAFLLRYGKRFSGKCNWTKRTIAGWRRSTSSSPLSTSSCRNMSIVSSP